MSDPTEPTFEVQVQWGVKIPMRDGVRLNATLYLPKDLKGTRPALFALTPYIAVGEHGYCIYLAEFGYPCLAIDVRGRGNSDGEFAPFFNDPNDGHDIVEWIAAQPWCNGKVATLGISYVGFTQWATVRGGPTQLATIVPSAPCWVGLDYPMRFNIFLGFLAQWSISTWGNATQSPMYVDQAFWKKRYMGFLEFGLPFKELPKYFGFESKFFQEWMQHPHQDEYWDRANPTPEQFANLSIPVLSLTGQLDGDQPGTLEFYRHHLKNAGGKAEHYLVIGPWDHPGVHTPLAKFAGQEFGPDSVVDMKKLHRDWYAWTMEGGEKPEFLQKKFAYYVVGAEKWRYADALDQATDHIETLFLDSTINPTNLYQSGTLAKEPAKRSQPDEYVYDPRDLSGPRMEMTLADGVVGEDIPISALETSLIYHSAPFEADTEVSGIFRLTAWLSIDQPDTDFIAYIFDVDPQGKSTYLASQILRARYREGLRVEKLIDTTDPLPYEFDRFFFISRRIKKGHRIRLTIGASHSMYFQKNYNSGKPVADETMQDARTVKVRLFHSEAYPSALSVPIGRPEP